MYIDIYIKIQTHTLAHTHLYTHITLIYLQMERYVCRYLYCVSALSILPHLHLCHCFALTSSGLG